MRELEEDAADESLNAEEDSVVEIRDLESIASSLPVFCVSARGYQRLRGHFKMDSQVNCFTEVEDTEIPALQRHCRDLSTSVRIESTNRFLTMFKQLKTSMSIWLLRANAPVASTASQYDSHQSLLTERVENLKKVRKVAD